MSHCQGYLVVGEGVNSATAVLVGQNTCPDCLNQAESIADALGTTVVPLHQVVHACKNKGRSSID